MLISDILKFLKEAEIIVNKGHEKNGNIVFLLGGGGSGKDFILYNVLSINNNNAKVFDVDALKNLVKNSELYQNGGYVGGDIEHGKMVDGKWQKQKYVSGKKIRPNKKLKGMTLNNSENVSYLHNFVDEKGLADKQISTFISSIESSKEKPNIVFNITGKDEKTIIKRLMSSFDAYKHTRLFDLYKPENIHVVWVLTPAANALKNNKGRDRVIPDDLLFKTHQGAKRTIVDNFLAGLGKLQFYVKGNAFIVFNQKGVDFSTNYKGHEGEFVYRDNKFIKHYNSKGELERKNKIPNVTGSINYVQIKKQNKPVIPFDELPEKFQKKILEYTEGL